ncbi:hypothetical protein P5673_014097 [Acropora cervicornis]|uniref:Uncharacterized protein n=1 Tax=Acropora cervicornis TaxID=6130 RepID=A0AAD9V5W7_ACRCE|nr:hypothetical protein P5673_014097 [Acropora cervicornis]
MEETQTLGQLVDSRSVATLKKNNLNVILENIYLEDRIHAVNMMARSRDQQKKKNRKRKRTSLVADAETFKQHDANGPLDKAKDTKAAKRARRRGKG